MTRRAFCLSAFFFAAACRADQAVWDPLEYARLAAQAANNNLAVSVTGQLQQQFAILAAALGSAGVRGPPAIEPGSSLPITATVLPAAPISPTATQLRQSYGAVRQAEQQAAVDGYALSLSVNRDLAGAAGRAQRLADQAAAAVDARADLQANSAVCLAILLELNAVEALLAVSLQQQALQRMSTATP
jgi:hypothetical protein